MVFYSLGVNSNQAKVLNSRSILYFFCLIILSWIVLACPASHYLFDLGFSLSSQYFFNEVLTPGLQLQRNFSMFIHADLPIELEQDGRESLESDKNSQSPHQICFHHLPSDWSSQSLNQLSSFFNFTSSVRFHRKKLWFFWL